MNIDLQRYADTKCLHYVGELCARIIMTMQAHGQVHLVTKEVFSFHANGLYDLLDQLCATQSWDKKSITVSNANLIEYHSEYQVHTFPFKLTSGYCYDFNAIANIPKINWNQEKVYGMFLGRANITRLQAIKNHMGFRFKDQGLVAWNADYSQLNPSVLAQYLCETNSQWSELEIITPFSEIGPVLTPPICTPQNMHGPWEEVYEKIAIEVVCETTDDSSAVGITEKLLRPMLYRRPFLLIAGANYIETMKQSRIYRDILGLDRPFDFFEDLVPNYDCCFDGASRSNFVFDRLQELIVSGRVNTVLEDFDEQIETNYRLAKSLFDESKDLEKLGLQPHLWAKPTY